MPANTTTIELKNTATFRPCEEDSGRTSDGENAVPGPGASSIASGFGGLGLEGIKGTDDSEGESSEPLGEGKRGLISGDNVGDKDEDGAI